MKKEEIVERIIGFLVDEFEVEEDKISPEADLKNTLDLDSLDYVDLVVEIENNFNFKVNPEDFKNIITFEDFYHYVMKRVNVN